MKKKLSIGLLLALFMLGTTLVALPPVKAEVPVRIYIKDFADGDNIYAGLTPPMIPIANLRVQVRIESDPAWNGQPEGIVGFVLSVRVDPRVLEVFDIAVADDIDTADGFSDGILEEFAAMVGGSVLRSPIGVDKATGTMYGLAAKVTGVDYSVTGGAGGDPFYGDNECGLATITFKTKSATQASVIDLMSPGELVDGINVGVRYQNAQGDEIAVEPEDGYYVAETPDITFHDLNQTSSVIGSLWHELWPEYCLEWRIDSEEDGDEILEVSDQIDMMLLPLEDYKAWYHVEWVNPDPVAGDGKTDLIVLWKEDIPVPEFPLGLGLMMLIALAIPIVYLWRTRKKVRS